MAAMIGFGGIVVLVTPRGRRYARRVEPGMNWHANEGLIRAEDIAEASYGAILHTNLGVPVRLEEATLQDLLMGIKRQTQIIYPKDIAYLCMRLGAGPGRLIAEAGCGSGGLTLGLSWFCGPTGKVVSHDSREEFVRLARRNLQWAGLGENVELHVRDIADGFAVSEADALFLDVREPWLYLEKAVSAIKPGAGIAFLLPTTPQVCQLLLALEKAPFGEIEVCEILLRHWKPLPDRLRPQDRMAAHTGFLIFARQQENSPEFETFMPMGTRQRKQEAARQSRQDDNGTLLDGQELEAGVRAGEE